MLFRIIPTKRHHREIIAHNPAKRRGWVASNAKRLHNFNALRALRGGFSDGCRNNAAKIYAWLLRANGVPRSDVLGLLTDMGEQCRPRLSKAEIIGQWNLLGGYTGELNQNGAEKRVRMVAGGGFEPPTFGL